MDPDTTDIVKYRLDIANIREFSASIEKLPSVPCFAECHTAMFFSSSVTFFQYRALGWVGYF